jgi:hypothetical protein
MIKDQAALEKAVRNRVPLGSTPARSPRPKPPKKANPVHKRKK